MKLYPTGRAFKREYLRVSPIHRLYLEQSGNPKGIPLVHLHGGPGSASKPRYRKFYNPEKYRIILFDQRGCGKSKPLGEIKENTTWDLVEDMEKIRKHLGIEKWVVVGGSWGSTLALAYTEKYPENVSYLLLRGIFTFRKQEVDWFTGNAKLFFPDYWEETNQVVPANLKERMNNYLYSLYLTNNVKKQLKTVSNFMKWHQVLGKLIPDGKKINERTGRDAIASEKILYYYIKNNGFLKEGELIKNADKISNIPTVIIQGRYDMCCPPMTAWELHKKLPKADFYLVPAAGHKADEPGILDKIIEYTNKFSSL